MKQFAIVSTVVILVGCSTLKDAQTDIGEGQSRQYAATYDQVWSQTVAVIDASKLTIVTRDKQRGEILAETGLSLLSYGENVAVSVQAIDEYSSRVEVVSKRALATNLTAKDWSDYILDNTAYRLAESPSANRSR